MHSIQDFDERKRHTHTHRKPDTNGGHTLDTNTKLYLNIKRFTCHIHIQIASDVETSLSYDGKVLHASLILQVCVSYF